MLISFQSSGSFHRIEAFLDRMINSDMFNALDQYAREGVVALAAATPKDTGLTANSWVYEIVDTPKFCSITWSNTNITAYGTPVAIMLQYGHGTGTGGYVQGQDYINPALRPIFDKIAENIWKAVTSS
jgi:hypothetical protein